MSELKDMAKQIEELRTNLQNLINEKDNLLDPEVLSASKMLDAVLVEYNKIINKSN